MVTGKIHLSGYYHDGIPSLIIMIKMEDIHSTHMQCNDRMNMMLKANGFNYTAGIRPAGKKKYLKICADLVDEAGKDLRLADVLLGLGYARKDTVRMQLADDRLHVLNK